MTVDPIYIASATLVAAALAAGFIQWLAERRWKRELEAEKAAKHSAE